MPQPATASPDLLSRDYWNGSIKMSLSKFFILRVLHDEPMHGYQIAQRVAALTSGCCSPAEGTLYPVLRQFLDGGYVTARRETVAGRDRRVYTLTRRGREAFRVAVEAWLDITDALMDCRCIVEAQ